MSKNDKKICLTQKKALIIGLIFSGAMAVISSYVGAYIMIDAGLGEGKFTAFTLGNIMLPIVFIIFEMYNILFISACTGRDDKK